MSPSAKAFKRARQRLGLDLDGMARALRLAEGRVVRRYENGSRTPGGPVMLCADLLPPLVTMLRRWDGYSDSGLLDGSGLSEQEADAVIELRHHLIDAGLLEKRTQ